MTHKHLRLVDHRFQATASGPAIPPVEVLACRPFIAEGPKLHGLLTQCPCSGRPQIAPPQLTERTPCRQVEFVSSFQPIELGALQPLVAFFKQLLVFRPANLIHCFAQVLRDVELVEDHLLLGLGQMGANRLLVGPPHVQGHSLDPLQLLLRQRRPKAIQARLLAVLRHVQDSASRQVVDHRQVLVPLAERLLVDPQICDHSLLSPCQTTLDGTIHDPMHLVPRQSQPIPHGFLAGRLQPVDRQTLEQRRKATVRLGPRETHHANSMYGTTRSRRGGVQDSAILAGVQMPPRPLGIMVMQRAQRLAFRTLPQSLRLVSQVHMDLALIQLQFHVLHSPRSRNPENLLIQLMVLHGTLLPNEKMPCYPLDGKKPNDEDEIRSGKRSRALLGSNPTRDTRVENVPKAPAPWESIAPGAFLFHSNHTFGHSSYASKNPGVWGRAPVLSPPKSLNPLIEFGGGVDAEDELHARFVPTVQVRTLREVGVATQSDFLEARLAAKCDGLVEIPGGMLVAGTVS